MSIDAPRLVVATACFAALSISSSGAYGAGLAELSRELRDLEAQAGSLNIRHQTQAATPDQIAEHRLVDAQVLYNLKDYTRAAIVLLDYVTKYKNTRGYPEAVYYLADSLYYRRDFISARRYFKLIVDQVRGPFYGQALQRLVELSLRTGDHTEVAGYLNALSSLPPGQMKSSVPYIKGKYLFFSNRTDEAITAFNQIAAGQPYHMQGQYFVGAALVRKKDFAGATRVFQAVLRVQPKDDAERHVRTLTHLALGRLLYHQNKISQAIDNYQKISRRAKEFDTALYEICWAYVKAGEHRRALRALDLLVLAHPKSPLIPEVRVLQGNLLIRLKQWGRATELFTETREKFLPIRQRMLQLLQEQEDPNVFFDVLLARNMGELSVAIQVPQLALHWVKQQPLVKRAMHLVRDVRGINTSVEAAKTLITRLERAVTSPGKIKIFPEFAAAKVNALRVENRLIQLQARLVAHERGLVGGNASATERQQLTDLEAQRVIVEARIRKLPTSQDGYEQRRRVQVDRITELENGLSELSVAVQSMRAQLVAAEKYFADTASAKAKGPRESFRREAGDVRLLIDGLQGEVDELRMLLADAKQGAGVGGAEEVAERQLKRRYRELLQQEHTVLSTMKSRGSAAAGAEFDQAAGMLDRSHRLASTIEQFDSQLEAEIDRKLAKIRTVLTEERGLVDQYHTEAAGYKTQTDQVAGGVTYAGFKKVGRRFYEIVVRADVGIIDVAWALKDEKTKEVSRLVRQQKLDLKLLDDEFRAVLSDQ